MPQRRPQETKGHHHHQGIMTLQVLSEGWTSAVVNGNLILIKVRSGTADESTVLYLVTVSVDFTWRVRRGEREVPRECELLIASPELLRSVEAVTQIIQVLDSPHSEIIRRDSEVSLLPARSKRE